MQAIARSKGQPVKPKVLIISDEPVKAKAWGYSLSQAGLDVSLIGLTQPALEIWEQELPDLIIIEDFNTEIEEIELCRELRAVSVVPILYLTNKPDEAFHLTVYQCGADECISYPITPVLFQAKVAAWLRRIQTAPLALLGDIRAAGFLLSPERRRLTTVSGETLRLTLLETRLLWVLMDRPGTLFESQEIIQRVWGYYSPGDQVLLKNLVYRLRRKIEPDPNQPRHLVTEGSRGYKFVAGA